MMAAAAAAAAAEAAARDTAEVSTNYDDSYESGALDTTGWYRGGQLSVNQMMNDPSASVSSFQFNESQNYQNQNQQAWQNQDMMIEQQQYQYGQHCGDDQQANDMNPINAMNTILQQMAAEQQYQQQQETQYGSQAELQQQLQQQLQEQLQEQIQQQLAAAAQAEVEARSRVISRPDEHFLTIALNGTILGATETVTGHPADSLLMTSIFDSVHHEDIIGLQTVATHFWEKGHPEVEAYFRRRGSEDEWVWLVAKVVTFIDDPVPGLVLQECRVMDERVGQLISRTIRVPALLVNQVEEAYLAKQREAEGIEMEDRRDERVENDNLRSLLENAAENGIELDSEGLNSLLENGKSNSSNYNSAQNPDPIAAGSALSIMEEVRKGVCLDLSKVDLSPAEVKLTTLILTGRLRLDDIGPIIMHGLNSGTDLAGCLEEYITLKESRKFEEDQRSKRASMGSSRDGSSHSLKRLSQGPKHSFENTRQLSNNAFFDDAVEFARRRNPTIASSEFMKKVCKLPPSATIITPPPLAVVNFSYTNLGNDGLEMMSEILLVETPHLKTVDIGFCGVEEKGILALSRAIRSRKKRALPSIQGLVLSGNTISYKAAKELGLALSSKQEKKDKRALRKRNSGTGSQGGYEEDDEFEEDDDFEDEDMFDSRAKSHDGKSGNQSNAVSSDNPDDGLRLVHLACASITPDAFYQLLIGLGQDCPIREFCFSSNNIGPSGANFLVSFLEGKGITKYNRKKPVMPKLDHIDLSNNNLGNDGTAKLTRAISKRTKDISIVDLRLSSNNIGAPGIETIMNKLLQHNLVSLSLDNNNISDRGCQLVAASLTSMHHLSHLNLSFNQIGSRGITALMRALVGCESMTSIGLSGNVVRISGAIAMGFALAQHPRLAELALDNCCLSQVAQCHIVAGIISNRWVPMRNLNGFQVGPPMVAIGALDVFAQSMCNKECFRIRRDIQMKTILQWMQNNQKNRVGNKQFISDFENDVSTMNEANDIPSQSAYLRMLDWLSKIPFDEDELTDLRRYFYDDDGSDGDGMRGSDGQINLKHRGDLLAALGSEVVEEIRENTPLIGEVSKSIVGLDLDEADEVEDILDVWNVETRWGKKLNKMASIDDKMDLDNLKSKDGTGKKRRMPDSFEDELKLGRGYQENGVQENKSLAASKENFISIRHRQQSSMSSISKTSFLSNSGSERSNISNSENSKAKSTSSKSSKGRMQSRISMFPPFARKLENLKMQAQELMDQEHDPTQQDIIAQLFAEASLTLLRQLRYHCMNNGLDGWRHGNIRRKILIVDDSKVTRKMVSRAFEKANFIVDTAENGKEGVAKLKESIYDIAFMDIDMPVMNGFDATKALREWEDVNRPGARQPICALTAAYVDDFERTELMKFKEAGVDVMESKPCNIPRLFKVVDDVSPMFSDLSISVTNHDANAT